MLCIWRETIAEKEEHGKGQPLSPLGYLAVP